MHLSGAHSTRSDDGVSMNTVLPLRCSVVFVKVTSVEVVVVVVVVVVVRELVLVLDCKASK